MDDMRIGQKAGLGRGDPLHRGEGTAECLPLGSPDAGTKEWGGSDSRSAEPAATRSPFSLLSPLLFTAKQPGHLLSWQI
ncbi:hypothetical protein DPEC_G00341690 [Dallia pectoralis]|uniref:Uncharacterized protein n=1 Tax=Dallia pectoralis TaxID=75939 RepID=A0ACC2F5K3_DALPE|nr:hypothetical protein DPEC_G00341690 [Dallia pectoralis]